MYLCRCTLPYVYNIYICILRYACNKRNHVRNYVGKVEEEPWMTEDTPSNFWRTFKKSLPKIRRCMLRATIENLPVDFDMHRRTGQKDYSPVYAWFAGVCGSIRRCMWMICRCMLTWPTYTVEKGPCRHSGSVLGPDSVFLAGPGLNFFLGGPGWALIFSGPCFPGWAGS